MKEVNTTLDKVRFSNIVTIRNKLMQHPGSIRLETGEPDFPTHPLIKEASTKALNEDKTSYAPSSGIPQLREAIFRKCTLENRISLNSPEDVIVTNGGVGAISYSLKAIINPYTRDEVIIPDPNWSMTEAIILFNNGIPVHVPLDINNGFRLDPEKVEEKISARTKAIVINSPHNPTGAVMSREDLEKIIRISEEHGLYLLSDEAYEHIIYEGEHIILGSLSGYEGIISLFTFSKTYSIPGLRMGYAVTKNKKIMENLRKTVLDTCNGVSLPTQYGVLAALANPDDINPWIEDMVCQYRKRRDILMQGINASNHFECASPCGTFYLFPKIKNFKGSDEDMTNILLNNNPPVGSVPGSSFGQVGKDYIRFAYSTSTKSVERAAEIIAELKL